MKRIVNKIIRISKYPIKDKLELVRILFILLKTRLIVTTLPLKYYYKKYISNEIARPTDLQPYQHQLRLINRVIRSIPLEVTCLMKVIILREYFLKYNLVLPVHIGVKTEPCLKAHAWISTEKNQEFVKIN